MSDELRKAAQAALAALNGLFEGMDWRTVPRGSDWRVAKRAAGSLSAALAAPPADPPPTLSARQFLIELDSFLRHCETVGIDSVKVADIRSLARPGDLAGAVPALVEPRPNFRDRLITEFCAKYSGHQTVVAGEVLDWIMALPWAAVPAPVPPADALGVPASPSGSSLQSSISAATPNAAPLPFAVFDEFGVPADDRVDDHAYAVIKAEREACAKVCDHIEATIGAERDRSHFTQGWEVGAANCAEHIRARSARGVEADARRAGADSPVGEADAPKSMGASDGAPVPVAPTEPRTEFGWLIENGKQQGEGLAYRFVDNDNGGLYGWTPDHNLALRFARRADAEQFAYHDEDAWRIVEHGWATAAVPVAEPPTPANDYRSSPEFAAYCERLRKLGQPDA